MINFLGAIFLCCLLLLFIALTLLGIVFISVQIATFVKELIETIRF